MASDLAAFVRGLPKAELHLHLEGTLEPELKFRLARRNGIELPEKTVDEVEQTYQFHDLTSFLQVYYPAMRVLLLPQDFHDLAYELSAQGACPRRASCRAVLRSAGAHRARGALPHRDQRISVGDRPRAA
ncbi:hypothetical protein ACRS6B_07325 [Nocardia asteroides]